MTEYLPLNGRGITDRVHRAMQKSNFNQSVSPAQGLANVLAGQPEPEYKDDGITGTGFGLTDSSPKPKTRAVDPSQGKGHNNRKNTRSAEDPLVAAFKHVLNF